MRHAALCLLALAGCATRPEPIVRTVEVTVPTLVSCVPADLPEPPAYPDTLAALRSAPGPEDRYQLLSAGWFPRNARLSLLESIIGNCRRTGPP